MPSRIRLDLSTHNPDLQDGLQARIHDPLWMLGRQWQFGEFNGADAGSPAAAQVIVDTAAVTRYQPGPRSGPHPARPYAAAGLALETLVEAEPVTDDSRLTGASRPKPDGICSACWKRPGSAPPAPNGWEALTYWPPPPQSRPSRSTPRACPSSAY